MFPSKGPGSTGGVASTLKNVTMSNLEKGKVFPPGTRKAKRMASTKIDGKLSGNIRNMKNVIYGNPRKATNNDNHEHP